MGFESFGGQDVVKSGLTVSNVGGGLHKAFAVDDLELPHGTRFVIVLDCEVAEVRFKPVDKEEPGGDLERDHVATCLGAAQVERTLVAEMLAAQKAKVDAAAGVEEIPFDELAAEAGFCPHDRPVGECSTCPAQGPAVAEGDDGDGDG